MNVAPILAGALVLWAGMARAEILVLPADWTLCGSGRPGACQPGTGFPDGLTLPLYRADAAAMRRLEAMSWPDPSLRADSLRVLGAINALAEDKAVTAPALEQLISEVYFAHSGRDISREVRYMGLGVYLERAGEDPVALAGREVWQRWSVQARRRVLERLEIPARPEQLDVAATRDPAHLATLNTLRARLRAHDTRSVLIVTGALDQGMAEVAFYRQALAAAGAAGQWLPVDPEFLRARDQDRCDRLAQYSERARVFSELAAHQAALCEDRARFQTLLDEADALLLAADSAERLRALLLDPRDQTRDWWATLVARFRNGGLLLIVHGDPAAVDMARRAAE